LGFQKSIDPVNIGFDIDKTFDGDRAGMLKVVFQQVRPVQPGYIIKPPQAKAVRVPQVDVRINDRDW
jgi:hypothetical protein